MAVLLVWLGRTMPQGLDRILELAAGLMLIGLGLDVLRRLRKGRVHFHVHDHGDGRRHFHAHSHADEIPAHPDPNQARPPGRDRPSLDHPNLDHPSLDHAAHHHHPAHHHHHPHPHSKPLLGRAMVVGSVHGLAGSGAVVLLALQGVRSAGLAMAYLAVFGLGSILGMLIFSLVISLPLTISSRQLGRISGGLQASLEAFLGLATIAMGIWMVFLGGIPFSWFPSAIH
jgi:ABC-type nickel/cobalt efflux system permease component RcnA